MVPRLCWSYALESMVGLFQNRGNDFLESWVVIQMVGFPGLRIQIRGWQASRSKQTSQFSLKRDMICDVLILVRIDYIHSVKTDNQESSSRITYVVHPRRSSTLAVPEDWIKT